MLDKTYSPNAIEEKIYDNWEQEGVFRAGAGALEGKETYSIVIPPPNVTGSLHMGHALNNTLQDALIRFERMRGKDVLWQPGMDHAGIATQMVVERQLMQRGEVDRRSMGREAFIEKIWLWKAESGGLIGQQLRRLGASCDWSRERFTMDDGLSKAVLKVFVSLYHEGLIYRDKRLVNWDPKLHTAISDLEVEPIEVKGHLWHFQYPIEGEEGRFITVATTRPETMLGDAAVAVHPQDERYQELIGKNVILPLVGRRIPIVADDYADPEAGSGAVKITPAHDFNDFEVGRRHDLAKINVMDIEACMYLRNNEDFLHNLPHSNELEKTLDLHGFDRFVARDLIVVRMDDLGLLAQVEEHTHMVPHGDRGGVPIEPFLTDQWYVDAKTLAEPALHSVREGHVSFVPKTWEKTYFEWMENIQPWCISRQLWWGHRIPVWYGPDGMKFVGESEEAILTEAEVHYGKTVEILERSEAEAKWQEEPLSMIALWRDEDVLDTWFSSALWPFSTLGWPDETAEFQRYYPTSVLITGFDIIFFWVARMMMMGLHFMGQEPFHTVYIHALVRDEKGQKMSKSKGNVIDPLEMIDEFGADALRFSLTAMAAQGRDIKLSKARVAGYRNFATKLWNATRFCQMNGCVRVDGFDPSNMTMTLNRWIVTETGHTVLAVTNALEAYRFNEAAGALYRFIWNLFCDWYLELAKPILSGEDDVAKAETRATAAWVIDQILKLLHPFMPFITEELWGRLGERTSLLALSRWPNRVMQDESAALEINWLIDLITQIRSVRSEMQIPPSTCTPLVVVGKGEHIVDRFLVHDEAIQRLARVNEITRAAVAPSQSVQIGAGDAVVCLPLSGLVDFSAEQQRLEKEIVKLDGEITRLDKKLSNQKFLANAPQDVVAGEREKRADYQGQKEKVSEALERVIGAI